MSQHPSLHSTDKDKQHRSVLKRYERLKILKDKEKWKEANSVFGLQKVKVVKFKIKKEKVQASEAAEEIAAPTAETTSAASAAKQAPQAAKAVTKEAARHAAGEAKK